MEREPSAATRKRIDHYSYKLSDRIGKGYSSQVYRGRDDRSNEPVALKVIDLKGLRDGVAREMLESEIAILKELSHPNILRCIDVLKTTNHCYIITELCESGDLAAAIKKKTRIPEAEALALFADIFRGFYEFGSQNILHRDLKPANIFLSNGVCKLADFGFAKKNTTPGLREKYNVGSPLYMSPESLKRNIYSVKNDIWSMGIILFEMLYGKTPWDCRSEKELIEKITKVPVSFPASPRVSEESKALIRQCLNPDEGSRIGLADMQALLARTAPEPPRDHRSTSFLPPVRVLGERNANDRRQPSSEPFAYKMNLSVTERSVKPPSSNASVANVLSNKENRRRVMSKEQAIERINHCRLVYKLKEQLGEEHELVPPLRAELLARITELHRESHSDRVRRVVDEYHTKYTESVKGKPQHLLDGFEARALKALWHCSSWAKEMLAAYLMAKRGHAEGIPKVLERCSHASDESLKAQLRAAGL
jgi:serine/threonine protein kinase